MLTIKTETIQETVIVDKEVKKYILELNEDQAAELCALLGTCCSNSDTSDTSIFQALDLWSTEKYNNHYWRIKADQEINNAPRLRFI